MPRAEGAAGCNFTAENLDKTESSPSRRPTGNAFCNPQMLKLQTAGIHAQLDDLERNVKRHARWRLSNANPGQRSYFTMPRRQWRSPQDREDVVAPLAPGAMSARRRWSGS